MQGVVVNDLGEKTVVVKVERRFTDPVMKKTVRRMTTYRAHDAANAARIGQTVRIEKTTSDSRTWELVDDGDEAVPGVRI
ncbi:30S ribosomal protein S17 [Methylobacterium sp. J-068]|uniref:30S ribosomal protein S17 n=1 Tax=Methylobacterium sp. J-068 TaxID=2836649 RepID=UPI001FBB49E1|nr:30S ribosomal protein S17 [Methylobacterium sp. J-068]MCJ2036863.1 ribosomal protein S17 [Methylobacterium sp. J-068]